MTSCACTRRHELCVQERDILDKLAFSAELHSTRIEELMTPAQQMHTASSDWQLGACLKAMQARRRLCAGATRI